jgi:hypothetical protein
MLATLRGSNVFGGLAGGEIRVAAFNEQADKFFEQVQVGAIVQLSKGSVSQKRPVRKPIGRKTHRVLPVEWPN